MVVSLGMSRSLAGFELAHQRNPNMTATGDPPPRTAGRACPLCPGTSDVNLFGNRRRVVHPDPKIAHRAFDFRVSEQQLDCTKVASPAVDQRGFRSPKRMSPDQFYSAFITERPF